MPYDTDAGDRVGLGDSPGSFVLGSRNVGWVMIAGAGLIIVSCFLPWQQLAFGYYTVNRTVLEYGKGLKIDATGWSVIVYAAIVALSGLRRALGGAVRLQLWRGVLAAASGGLTIGIAWLTVRFQGVPSSSVTRGIGGGIALAGVALASGSLFVGWTTRPKPTISDAIPGNEVQYVCGECRSEWTFRSSSGLCPDCGGRLLGIDELASAEPASKESEAPHFGNEERTEDFYDNHSDTHGNGYQVEVPNSWLQSNNIETREGTGNELEYPIPRELFDEFNQFPRAPWAPGAS